jgi:hypothetical protein
MSTAGDMGELLRRANLELGGAVPQQTPHTGTVHVFVTSSFFLAKSRKRF